MNITMVRETKQTKIKGSVKDIEGVKQFTKAIIYEVERFRDSEEALDIEFHICIKAREEKPFAAFSPPPTPLIVCLAVLIVSAFSQSISLVDLYLYSC